MNPIKRRSLLAGAVALASTVLARPALAASQRKRAKHTVPRLIVHCRLEHEVRYDLEPQGVPQISVVVFIVEAQTGLGSSLPLTTTHAATVHADLVALGQQLAASEFGYTDIQPNEVLVFNAPTNGATDPLG